MNTFSLLISFLISQRENILIPLYVLSFVMNQLLPLMQKLVLLFHKRLVKELITHLIFLELQLEMLLYLSLLTIKMTLTMKLNVLKDYLLC